MSISIKPTVAVLGGAGKAGRPLIEEALRQGYTVRALLRHPSQFELSHNRLTIITGDARDPLAIRHVVKGSAALVSTLGNPRGENTPILSQVTEQLLPALKAEGISRYITLTSLYATEGEQADEKTRLSAAFMQQHFPAFMADRVREYQLLQNSDLDWTYVRIPYLVQSPVVGTVQTQLGYMPGSQLAVADLATFLLKQLDSEAFIRKSPFVANT
ncbi:NAD(P)H-binding protein [Fibrella sp. HMF5335]|uniref:NAD(P)H-binding protein n=1 Tax=Fibrella rubiginis TaxID=2817060 RepID=A0A939K7X1_9BACT|nr:NAD(P)H-binding protein [Fibrella rubiginis]MBO0939100.1 NAD(P)H-binding protein [Fibrella rubiginis]